MNNNNVTENPRIIVIQKLYAHTINADSELTFPKNRYKKFIKDVVTGTIERKQIIKDLMVKELKEDINENKTELIIKIMIMAAIYEFLYMHKVPIKVVINEYLKASEYFIKKTQSNFLNAILDKVSKLRNINNE